MNIHFKDVGQGDSIILEWEAEARSHLGLIDAKVYNGINPILEFLSSRTNYSIDFIVLTHFHDDHFSGLADIMDFCIDKRVRVQYFYHTLGPFVLDIYNRIFTSKRIERNVERFFNSYEAFSDYVEDSVQVHHKIAPFPLSAGVSLSFLAPYGRIYDELARQLSRKVNKIATTSADINKLSTVIKIHNGEQCILLTSDAVKKSFKHLRNSVKEKATLIQVPHHGSIYNLDPKFWTSVSKRPSCPAMFSVGDVPRDRLPNRETVKFFHDEGYEIHATNQVYGIAEYFDTGEIRDSVATSRSLLLNSFSVLTKRTGSIIKTNLTGDQVFQPFATT